MIFHDSTKKYLFSTHQNKADFKNLDDCEVISTDFPGLKTSAASMSSIASFCQKIADPDGWIIPSTQMINISPLRYIERIIKNPIFPDI